MARALLGFATLLALAVGCDDTTAVSPDAAAPDAPGLDAGVVAMTVALNRDPAPDPDDVLVDVTLTIDGVGRAGATVATSATSATVGPPADLGDGRYRIRVSPTIASGVVELSVTALGQRVDRTALILPVVASHWGQPELVPGLVNTPGYEDSAEVSPDGAWLLVSDTSPLDIICCALGCGSDGAAALDPAGAACNVSLGPLGPPARPRFPGAERFVSPTVVHDELPPLCVDLPPGQDFAIAFPPVAAYGFRRQPDGSFAEPFLIAFDAAGMPGLYGLTFAAPPVGTAATVVFAHDTLDQSPTSPGVDLFRESITLGADHRLGTYQCVGGVATPDRYPARVPLTDPSSVQGNPTVVPDGIIYDSENAAQDLFFVAGDPLGATPLAAPVRVALSTAERHETMPYFRDGRLFFSADNQALVSSARAPGGNPGQAATWGPERTELALVAPGTSPGEVVAIGEPSIEERSGVTSLYFVYGLRTATGTDLGVARVRAAP